MLHNQLQELLMTNQNVTQLILSVFAKKTFQLKITKPQKPKQNPQ